MTPFTRHTLRHVSLTLPVVCALLAAGSTAVLAAEQLRNPFRIPQDRLASIQKQFRTGQYEQCLESSKKAVEENLYGPDWGILKARSLTALGQYDEAASAIDDALRQDPTSIRLSQEAYNAYRQVGRNETAMQMLMRVYRIATSRRQMGVQPVELVALGDALLQLGGEPKVIMSEFYNRAIQADPNCREAYLAAGALAIAKQDYDLAAQQYRKALERFGDEPDAHYGLAQAFYQSDREAMMRSIDAALVINPKHAPSLILLAEHLIDCEDYQGATKTLQKVIDVNPWHPQAWAYRSMLALMANDPNAAKEHRSKALKFWTTNPEVDYLIGRKLSQRYWFLEGSSHQYQSLAFDPTYLPAKAQLSEDMLRLGQEQRGWELAEEVHRQDPYNVNAYNLVSLKDNMAKLRTIKADGLVVRMDPVEADVYGDRIVRLLQQASDELCRKYSFKLDAPVTVELFANQQDFAVRTFGMPGGDGYLGVCFGHVITANSPKIERPANWEATLWHEFVHVITLNLTKNKMPRWFSEGISVYEEWKHSPTWGQQMTPQYRTMILGEDLTPVGQLSSAFMSPKTPTHLQFAYYESALVIEFLVDKYGMSSLKAILADLGNGREINDAISQRAAPIGKFEEQFTTYARKRAEALAPGVDWEEPAKDTVNPADPQAISQWLDKHPNSYWALNLQAESFIAEQRWQEAKAPLEKLISLYPQNAGDGNPYVLLAGVHRRLDETDQECLVLSKLAAIATDVPDVYRRLTEIETERKDWKQVLENSNRFLSVYPMLPAIYNRMGRAAEELGQDEPAIDSYRRLLLLDPADPVDVNYRLALLLQNRDPAAAKRHVLKALSDAPRFRQAHQLLLKMEQEKDPATSGGQPQ
jgi:tetratricopeptide (TPR) repeat protein